MNSNNYTITQLWDDRNGDLRLRINPTSQASNLESLRLHFCDQTREFAGKLSPDGFEWDVGDYSPVNWHLIGSIEAVISGPPGTGYNPTGVAWAVVAPSGDEILIGFNGNIKARSDQLPPASAFTVKYSVVGGDAGIEVPVLSVGAIEVESVQIINGITHEFKNQARVLTLTLPDGAIGQTLRPHPQYRPHGVVDPDKRVTVTVDYEIPDTFPILTGTGGNAVLGFTDRNVTNNSREKVRPVLASATVTGSGTRLNLLFNKDLDIEPDKTPPASAFTVRADGGNIEVELVTTLSNSELLLTLPTGVAIGQDQTVTVSYRVPASNFLADRIDGEKALAFRDRMATNNSTVAATARQTVAAPLTASFEDRPASHDGETAFTFRLTLSEPVGNTVADIRDHALTVTGGSVASVERIGATGEAWSISIDPDGSGDVQIAIAPGGACGTPGALCTADGRALSNAPAAIVAGPEETVAGPAPLTARFANLPSEHDGETPFTMELVFSAVPHGTSNLTRMNNHAILRALQVDGGTPGRMRRVNGDRAHRTFRVVPDGLGAVTVSLPPTADCGAPGRCAPPRAGAWRASSRPASGVPSPSRWRTPGYAKGRGRCSRSR